jgi:ABC-type multidrug transport system fused ATPase/permease subunit
MPNVKPSLFFLGRAFLIFLLIVSVFLILFLGIYILISFINNIDWNYIKDQDNIDKLINILVLAFSASAFFAILLTVYYESRRRRNELQQITIDLFKEWRSQAFREARLTASKHVLKQWHDVDFRDAFCKSFIAVETRNNFKVPEEHIQAVSDIIGFYSILSLYRGNQEDIKNLSYFYYGWWRKLLYDVAFFRDNQRQNIVASTETLKANSVKLDRDNYLNSIMLVPVLKRLDKLCEFTGVPTDYDLMKPPKSKQ